VVGVHCERALYKFIDARQNNEKDFKRFRNYYTAIGLYLLGYK